MNIFDELAESYTYNGVVSLKALEDDIVTLENQIDSFTATLKELQLRGKKPGLLVGKLRDAKIRLSLLKAVYKRESDRNTSDDVILNMLGISANNAKEVEKPETAVEGREPVPQDFAESEVEIVEETVEDVEIVESEEDPTDEVITEEIEEKEEPADALVPEEEEEFSPVEADDSVDDNQDIKVEDTQVEVMEDEELPVKSKIEINEETGEIIVNPEAFVNQVEYNIPVSETVEDITYPDEPVENFVETLDVVDDCPPPTIDDYYEPIEEAEPIYYDKNYDAELEITDIPDEQKEKDVVIEDGMPEPPMDFYVYEPFYKQVDEIYSSFDLSPYTNMVNTDSVTGAFDNRKKTLEITFSDIRDYSIFVKLLKEKRPGLFSFLEKPKSIFMYVHEKHGSAKPVVKKKVSEKTVMEQIAEVNPEKPKVEKNGNDEEKIYHYEFTGCRLKKLFDTRYSAKRDVQYSQTLTHECTAVFKYKKLKLS